MKTILVCLFLSASLYYPCKNREIKPVQKDTLQNIPAKDTSVSFTAQIQPILVKNCSPCHFTGGKMYERLPFDKAATVLKTEAQPGILKRIKDEKENALIRQFIEQGGKK